MYACVLLAHLFTLWVVGESVSAPPTAGTARAVSLGSGVTMTLVWVPAGNFTMGSPESEDGRYPSEGPLTQVTFSSGFWMAATEVTQAQWKAVMGAESDPATFKGDDLPVETVSWNEAVDFCGRLSNLIGETVTLPTEAQWEYACRAGSQTRFHFGDGDATLRDYDWVFANSSMQTHPVGSKFPNAWGLYDMHGNVREWCLDWWADSLPGGSVTDPTGPATGSRRVLRGGDHGSMPFVARAAHRSRDAADYKVAAIGFRVVSTR
ncbi:MAG: formylglycine-generating enzyme family protein [Candidatus Sumerlaeia bacterium]|nr:formylglycine-generating enzyme family protein [Candidatus Sumerlaeia bacterium]